MEREYYSTSKRPIIDCITGEIYDSVHDAARKLNCTACNISRNIICNWKVKGHILEYLDYYEDLHNDNDENYKCAI